MTYIVDDKVLLSEDAFGGFSIPPIIFDDDDIIPKYLPFARKYVATIVGRYREYIIKGIVKLESKNIEVKIIAPIPGLMWRSDPQTIINHYLKWARAVPEKGKVVIVYSLMYGSVEKAALVAIEKLNSQGYHPVVFKFTDKHYDPISDLLGDVLDAEALIIATATYEANVFPT